jgi:hypothetical protein
MLSVVPMLAVQRELYDLPRGMDRFRRYLAVMTGGTDNFVLPLQAMNPMGKEHVAVALDALLALGAEAIAAEAIAETERRLGGVEADFRVGVVIADDVAGGWTNRELIEAQRLRSVPKATLRRGWIVAVYWASEPASRVKVREEVLSAIYRDLFLELHGEAKTLRQMMALEGRSRAFAGATTPALDAEELAYTREVIRSYLDAAAFEEFPTIFTCLYGDQAARRVGYSPLGLSPRAGCALALAEARAGQVTPEAAFLSTARQGWALEERSSPRPYQHTHLPR